MPLSDLWDAVRFFNTRSKSFAAREHALLEEIAQLKIDLSTTIELPKDHCLLTSSPVSKDEFIQQILHAYGFTSEAAMLISTAPIIVKDLISIDGGGLTYWDHIELPTVQHEAALHEFCHWVHQRVLLPNADLMRNYIHDYKKLALEDTLAGAFAKLQLYGDPVSGWPGIIALNDLDHALVSMCSWHMGKYKSGPRQLPKYMWKYFDRILTGRVLITPYYEVDGFK